MTPKGLSISCLALEGQLNDATLNEVVSAGFSAVEVVPTLLWPSFPNVSDAEVIALANMLNSHGVAASGMQSILFGLPTAQLLDRDTWPLIKERIRRVAHVSNLLGSSVLVFGSPKNRLRREMSKLEADCIATEVFLELVPVLEASSTTIAIEPNAPEYGADYLMHAAEVSALVARIGSTRIGCVFDSGCLHLVGDDLGNALRVMSPIHIHISEPRLEFPPVAVDHPELVYAITETGYHGWLVLEALHDTAAGRPVAEATESFVDMYLPLCGSSR